MSPFFPWQQPAALPPGAEQKAPPGREKNWWERGLGRLEAAGGFTMPWQPEHWENQPDWTRHLGKAGLGVGLGALGALGGMAIPPALAGLSGVAPWLTGPALSAMAHPMALGLGGGLTGLAGSSIMAPGGVGEPGVEPPRPGTPLAPPAPPAPAPAAPPTLPQPGEGMGGPEPTFFTDETGQRWVYNEYTGAWSPVQAPSVPGLTPEQQTAQDAAQQAHQLAMLKAQSDYEQQQIQQQAGLSRKQQEAAAAQQMAQMYAADPYKYWAQMGQGTPGAVAQLTGGEIEAGDPFGHVPLSTPSAQWWQNLLPSEQQQISGGLNWMGVDPSDWYSMYQRMIPGLGARQMAPQWAR